MATATESARIRSKGTRALGRPRVRHATCICSVMWLLCVDMRRRILQYSALPTHPSSKILRYSGAGILCAAHRFVPFIELGVIGHEIVEKVFRNSASAITPGPPMFLRWPRAEWAHTFTNNIIIVLEVVLWAARGHTHTHTPSESVHKPPTSTLIFSSRLFLYDFFSPLPCLCPAHGHSPN